MQSRTIEKIKKTLKKHKVTRAAVFGSAARGNEKPTSDIDLVIEPPKKFTLLDMVGLKIELESLLKKNVDIITFKSINKLLNPYIEKDIPELKKR